MKPKAKKVSVSCLPCTQKKTKCSNERPCEACCKRGSPHLCTERPTSTIQRKRNLKYIKNPCLNCKIRKISCSHTRPCSKCISRGIECVESVEIRTVQNSVLRAGQDLVVTENIPIVQLSAELLSYTSPFHVLETLILDPLKYNFVLFSLTMCLPLNCTKRLMTHALNHVSDFCVNDRQVETVASRRMNLSQTVDEMNYFANIPSLPYRLENIKVDCETRNSVFHSYFSKFVFEDPLLRELQKESEPLFILNYNKITENPTTFYNAMHLNEKATVIIGYSNQEIEESLENEPARPHMPANKRVVPIFARFFHIEDWPQLIVNDFLYPNQQTLNTIRLIAKTGQEVSSVATVLSERVDAATVITIFAAYLLTELEHNGLVFDGRHVFLKSELNITSDEDLDGEGTENAKFGEQKWYNGEENL